MLKSKKTATAGELVRQFSYYSDLSLKDPVIVTKNGRPRNVLLSVEEYERLMKRDRRAFLAADTPEEFIPQLEALARGKTR
jgi:PHD/YefM family antitoxin component YafN of YafNO toxin-antitoxin module